MSFERFLASVVKPTAAERKLLLDGAPVTKLLDGDPSKEIAVFGAVWIDAPRERYAAAVKDIERFESGGAFRITRKISVPPTLADFAELRLPEEDVADLGDCEVGDCELKMGKQSIDAIRSRVNFSQPGAKSAVEAVFRERAYEYVTAYREKGNAGLAVYRDASRPTFVANELKSMIDRMPTLDGLDAGAANLSAAVSERHTAELDRLPVLAGGAVRTEADHSHQPSRDPGERERNGRGVEDAVREPLLLDGARGASPGARSRARVGFLVHHGQSLSIGWLERFYRTNPSGPSKKRSAARDCRRIEADEGQYGRPALGARKGGARSMSSSPTTLKVLIFAASLRAESLNRKLAVLAARVAEQNGATVDLASMRDFDVSSYDGDVEAARGIPSGAQELQRRLLESDAFIISSPESNALHAGCAQESD